MSTVDLTLPDSALRQGGALSIEGGLIGPDQIARITRGDAKGQKAADYRLPKGIDIRREAERGFHIAHAIMNATKAEPKRLVQEMLRDVFGFADLEETDGAVVVGRRFPIALRSADRRVPVVVCAPHEEHNAIERAVHETGDDGRYRSPAMLLQDFLNADEASLWGIVTDGRRIRLMRDSVRLGRPAFLEADLAAIVETDDLSAFTGLWLLIHRSRFGYGENNPAECPLEEWLQEAQAQGVAARERLRDGVEHALRALGAGVLADPNIRHETEAGTLKVETLHKELLRLVYRIIFLLTAEDRGLLHAPDATDEAREAFGGGYSMTRAAARARRRSTWDNHHDAYEAAKIVMRSLHHGESALGLPALGGLFASNGTPVLDRATIRNEHWHRALFHLAWLIEPKTDALVRINWRDMQTEELGSVYESLLELVPRLADGGTALAFAGGAESKGNERKTTGSYYTPDALVQALLDSALDPVVEERRREGGADAILAMKVIDPACGSGHFLLAAARRMAEAVARDRAETDGERAFTPAAYREALREVVARCIHGVDRNDFAIELARVALWIETVDPGKPLGFLDANLRVGDSLLGVFDLQALRLGIPDEAYKPLTGDDKKIASELKKRNKAERDGQGEFDFSGGGGTLPPELTEFATTLRAMPEDTVEQVEAKQAAFEARTNDANRLHLKNAADFYVAAFLMPKTAPQTEGRSRPEVPTTRDVWEALAGRHADGRLNGLATEAALAAHAFHWPLAFPDVMEAGGFDAVLGNPPWERIKLQEKEFFASRAPEIAEAPNAAARGKMIRALAETDPDLFAAFETEKRVSEAASVFARVPDTEGGRFPLTGRGDVNTYALFAELFARCVNDHGRAGAIVPTGIVYADTCKFFFKSCVERRKIIEVLSFYEVRYWFKDTDDRNPFCILILGNCVAQGPSFVFDAKPVSDLRHPERRFVLSPNQIAAINPNTNTAPVFRSRCDAELIAKIYERVPVLIEESKGKHGNPWGVSFITMFHMSNDSELFRTTTELEDAGFSRDGMDWVEGSEKTNRYRPLYEAKMIHQFDPRWATFEDGGFRDVTTTEKKDSKFDPTPRYWVEETEVAARLGAKSYKYGWLIGWRDITNSSAERTLIASALINTAVGNSLPLMLFDEVADVRLFAALQGNLSALTFDCVARQKLGGTHANYFIYQQLPVLPPSFYTEADLAFITPRVLELTYTSHSMRPFAEDLGYDGPPFEWDDDRRAVLRAELDAFYARAYGLTRDELRYILDPTDVMGADYPSETFRVLQKNELRDHGEYRTQRLVLEAWDRLDTLLAPAPDVTSLPDNAWAWEIGMEERTRIRRQLRAVLRTIGVSSDARRVRLTTIACLEPSLLALLLDGDDRQHWLRLTGARTGTQTLRPSADAAWGDVYQSMLTAATLTASDDDSEWGPGAALSSSGADTQDAHSQRAAFAWAALRDVDLENTVERLPAEQSAVILRFVGRAA